MQKPVGPPSGLRASAVRLVGGCRVVGHDAETWRVRLAERLLVVLDADRVEVIEFVDDGEGGVAVVHAVRAGDGEDEASPRADPRAGKRRTALQRVAGPVGSPPPPAAEPVERRVRTVHSVLEPGGVVISSWCSGGPSAQLIEVFGAREGVVAGGEGDEADARDAVDFVHQAHREVAGLLSDGLVTALEDPLLKLPPQRHAVLTRLLAGDSEKQVAIALGISPHTAHQHTRDLYRDFRVSSRGELLARFIPRPGG